MADVADDLFGPATPFGEGVIRPAGFDDEIEGVRPRVVAEPGTPEALAGILKKCNDERLTVVVRGGGTKLGWGQPPGAIDLVLSTKRLSRVLAHASGDLTATVESGASLRAVNLQFAHHRQRLPIDAPFDEATIGGTIATNDSGPMRHKHGTPRDLLIGIRLATTDGRLVKAGGNVVKNVAGYDLGRLMSGSFGSLAVIVSATFKLAPTAASSGTLIVTCSGAAPLSVAAAAISASQLEPAAFDVRITHGRAASHRFQLLIQFATTPEAIRGQIERAQSLVARADRTEVITGPPEADAWSEVTRGPWAAPGMIVKVSWLQSSLPAVAALVEELGRSADSVELVGRVVTGAGFLRLQAGPDAQVAAVERLRAAGDVVGNVVVLRADPSIKRTVGVFGPRGDAMSLMREIKLAFDPAGILNAGRGLV